MLSAQKAMPPMDADVQGVYGLPGQQEVNLSAGFQMLFYLMWH